MKIKDKNYYKRNLKIDRSILTKSMIMMLGIWNSKKMIKSENRLIYKCNGKEFNSWKMSRISFIRESLDYMF